MMPCAPCATISRARCPAFPASCGPLRKTTLFSRLRKASGCTQSAKCGGTGNSHGPPSWICCRQRSIDRPLIPLLRQPRQRPGVVCVAVGQKDSPQFLNLLCIQPGQVVLCASQQTAIHQKSSTILFHIKAVAAMFAAAPGNKKFHLNAPSDDRSPCSRSAVPWSKTTHTAPPSPCQPKRCPAQIPAR